MRRAILLTLIIIQIFSEGCSSGNSDSILSAIGLNEFNQEYEITIFYSLRDHGDKIMLTKELRDEFKGLLSKIKYSSKNELDQNDFEVGSYITFSFYESQELIIYLTWVSQDSTNLIMHTSSQPSKYYNFGLNVEDMNMLQNFVDTAYEEFH